MPDSAAVPSNPSGPVAAPDDEITVLFRLGLGPWLTCLRGKVPVLDAWQSLPPVDEATVRDWHESGLNLGFRTGARSGLVVIDDDQPRHGGGAYVPPPTGLVSVSPTGGKHYYYRAPTPCPHNSASRLAPHVDIRGSGGQVVIPPSVHPTERAPYRWESTGEPGVFPADALAAVTPAGSHVDLTRPVPATNGTGYAETAMTRELARVRAAAEGTRNDALNRAAFSLGQLVAGGSLSGDRVRAELTSAAGACGLEQAEATATIRSGLTAGASSPRSAPVRVTIQHAPIPDTLPRESPDVLVPGSHVLPGGEYIEQGNHAFAGHVLSRIDPGALYRRAAMLGEIHGGLFVPATVNRLRTIIDQHVRLTAGKEGDDDPVIVFRACSHDHAAIVLDYPGGAVRNLQHLATYPVCVGSDFAVAEPGWNADSGVFLTCDDVPEPLDLPSAKAVLEDLVHDFPFAEPSDRANFFGLLLTPILRPAINEPVPMHLIGSPMERTGKTKLAEIVLGVAISGHRLPAMQLGEREEEREKRILSVLLRGQGLLHLDNLRDFLDSPALASLLTSSEYQGRLLGQSAAPSIPNGLTVVGTGNNVHATGEIAKRIVPIRLMPASDSPETRQDFRHADLFGYVATERARVQAALLGLVAAWRDAGRPLHSGGFGGFERWTAVVGGIMGVAGYPEWLSNMTVWRGEADDSGQEHRDLVAVWHERWGSMWTSASLIYDLAVELGLYGWLDRSNSDRAKRTSFGMRVLNRLANRVLPLPRQPDCGPVACRLEVDGVGGRRKARLVQV